ncbi:MAG: tRNA-guanine transglycosylase, partial [Microgenomates group bacterium]
PRKRKNFSPSSFKNTQYLYGVIQGGVFEDLRKKSAEFVVSQNTEGVAIGGVSVGESKKEMRDQVRWVADYLPEDRPVHLLGVGQFDDILDLVGYGIDTFDCVEPTRLARMGRILKLKVEPRLSRKAGKNSNLKIKWEKIDIFKGAYRGDFSPVDENCHCYVCQNFTKSYLHHLFKNHELLSYTLATYHNLWVIEKFFAWIREMIKEDLI